MGNLNLILFISIVSPLTMMAFVYKGKSRVSLIFLIVGITVCLFCGELNGILFDLLHFDTKYYANNITPIVEEISKALPIMYYAFLYKPKKQNLLEGAIGVGIGFAILENAFVLASNISTISIPTAFVRGFGSGMVHGVCTLAVGYGMTFVHTRRKLFYTGTTALLSAAVVYHSIYNNFVQSDYQWAGYLLPMLTFIPLFVMLKRKKIL